MPAPPLETSPGAHGGTGGENPGAGGTARAARSVSVPVPGPTVHGVGGGASGGVSGGGGGEGPISLTREDARDLALVQAHRSGDRNALSELLTAYQDRLFGVCLRMTSDAEAARDLTQEAMVKIIAGIGQFNGHSKLSTWLIRITMNVCLTERRRQRIRKTISLDGPGGPGVAGAIGRGGVRTPTGSGGSDGYRTLDGNSAARAGGPGQSRGAWAGMTGGSGASGGGGSLGESLDDQRELSAPERVLRSEDRERLYAAMDAVEPSQRAILILRDVQSLDYRQIAEVMDIPEGTVKSRLFRARLALREAMVRLEGGG